MLSASKLLLLGSITLILAAGCIGSKNGSKATWQIGEPLVLADQSFGALAFLPHPGKVRSVRSTYLPDLSSTLNYEADRDYLVDWASGQLRRTANSRIPNFRTNVLYAQEDFRHERFPNFGNGPFFVYVDYKAFIPPAPTNSPEMSLMRLTQTREKLRRGPQLRIVAFGDSITAGGDASEAKLIFWQRWADELQLKYPRTKIEAINGATGGDTTVQGLQRLESKVLTTNPDLVLIGFGMNDHNREGYGVPLKAFAENLRTMIDRIRNATKAEIILFSAFPPNPKWHYGSHNMAAYAAATESVAREKQCAFADVYRNWMFYAGRKKPEDLLANNINHPNDFGHWIYFRAFRSLGL